LKPRRVPAPHFSLADSRKPLMSSPAVAIFARAPSPGKAKTRLIPLLGPRGAAELHAALVRDALRKVDALAYRVTRYFFLAGRNFPRLLSQAGYTLARQRGAGLSAHLESAFRRLLRRHACAVVMGTDSPLLPPRIVDEALRELRVCDAVLGPCPDGGYYLIGLRRPQTGRVAAGMFRGIRWGTAFALRDTLHNLLSRSYSCSILEPYADVDVPADVRRLENALGGNRKARRLAPATWCFLKRNRMVR
jgi:hypothetical protein